MATATFSITNSTLDDNNLFKTDFVCEIAGASPYQGCQMQLSYYSPSAQGDVSLDSVYGTADGEGNVVLTYHLDGNRDVGGETLASIIFPSNSSTTSINCVASNSAGIIGFERFTLTLDAPPIFSDVTISSNRGDGVYVQGMTRIDVSAKIEPRFGSSIESAALYLTDSVGGSVHLGMAYSTAQNKWFGYVNVTYAIHSGNALLSIQATSGRGTYNNNIAEIIIKEHAYPSITIDCFRCDSNGDRDMNGDHISVTAYANSVPVELGITVLQGRIYPYPGPEEPVVWTNLTNGVPTLFEEASLSPDGTITTDEVISPDKGYRVAVQTSDGHYSSSKHIDIPPVNRIINVKDGGTGVAFGKLATEDALLDSAWAIKGMSSVTVQTESGTDATQPSYVILDHTGSVAGVMRMTTSTYGDNKYPRRYIFQQYALDSSTAERLPYKDVFRLPAGEFDLTADGTYEIITTKNLTDIPDASATARGLVSTGAQTFGGAKTFNGIAKFSSSEGTPEIHFVSKSNDPADYNGIMYLATPLTGSNRRTDRFIFRGMSYNSSTGARLTNYENYRLPSVNADRTSNATYDILTSKAPVTIAQGGTGQTGTTTETTIANIITAASGITISSASYAQWGKVAQVDVVFSAGNAISIGANGDVSNFTVGFLVEGKRPAIAHYGVLGYGDANGCAIGQLTTAGAINVREFNAMGVARTIAAGTSIRLTAVYLLA